MAKSTYQLVLDGEIFLEERKGKKLVSKDPIDGKLVLELLMYAISEGLYLLEKKKNAQEP